MTVTTEVRRKISIRPDRHYAPVHGTVTSFSIWLDQPSCDLTPGGHFRLTPEQAEELANDLLTAIREVRG